MTISGFENKDYRNGFDEGYEKGRTDAYNQIINFCEKHSYTCRSSEMGKLLREMMEERNGERVH